MLELYEHWRTDSPEIREFLSRRYIERIIGCIENVTNSNCTLTNKQKKSEIKRMISSERTRETVKIAKPNSKYMKLMLLPIKWNNATLAKLEGNLISAVKSRNTKVFAKLKAGR